MIKAEVVADSLSPQGHRLTTMLVTMPRFILAELNTHRMLSKNSASSRAIPFNKMVQAVKHNPFIPIAWQKDHKGMQGNDYITDETDIDLNVKGWLRARDGAISMATYLNHGEVEGRNNGVSKQLCNRLLEPFMYHTVLISGTEWENFFNLRCPQYQIDNVITIDCDGEPTDKTISLLGRSKKDLINSINELGSNLYDDLKTILGNYTNTDWLKINTGQAEIHMMAVAEAMWDAMNESTPKQLQGGEWHIPWQNKIVLELAQIGSGNHSVRDEWTMDMIKVSTSMAARTSYTTVGDEKEFTWKDQIALHNRMANANPFHASPFEHCAKVMDEQEYDLFVKGLLEWTGGQYSKPLPKSKDQGWCRNYRGFIQYRHILEQQKQ